MTDLEVRPDIDEKIDEKINQELLEEARRGIGVEATSTEVINAVLRLYVEEKRVQRRRFLDDLQRMAAEGLIDFDAIERGRQ